MSRGRAGALAAALVALAAILVTAGLHATPYNNYVLLAQAFRHGHAWIDWPGPYIDALPYHGRYYVIEAPLPAILLLPVVTIAGAATNQSMLAAVLAAVATFAGWELGRRFGVTGWWRFVLVTFLLLGTDLYWTAVFGSVWLIAHTAAVAFTLLAVLELTGSRRGWLVALYAACALESRFTLVLELPVYAAMLWYGTGLTAQPLRRERLRTLGVYVAVLAVFAVATVAYNEARWGLPYDIGYTAWYHQDNAGMPTGSPFRLDYLRYQLWSFFVQVPDVSHAFPYLNPSYSGVALTWTSPGLLLAFFAHGPRRFIAALWVATVLAAAPNFVYYVNGYAQFGMRHALDFEPYLFVLMLLAAHSGLSRIWTAICAYSALVGAWGVWYWRVILHAQ